MRAFDKLLLLSLVASGCKWTDFDDLEAETWVTSTEKPNDDSTDFGVGLARGNRTSGSGGKIVALGASQPQYLELAYSSNGDAEVGSSAFVLSSQFTVGNLDVQPILLADPGSDEVALVMAGSGGNIFVLHGSGGLEQHAINGPPAPDAATYMVPPPSAGNAMPKSAPLVAAADSVYGSFYPPATAPTMLRCQLLDAPAGMPVTIRALGAARITSMTADDVLVWGTVGMSPTASKLYVYRGTVFNGNDAAGCTGGMATPLASVDVPFAPLTGSQIISVDSTNVLLVGHKEITNTESYLALYNVAGMNNMAQPPTRVGNANTVPGLRTAAVLDLGAQKFVLAGYPFEIVEGVKGGRVVAFPLTTANGLGEVPALVLHDAEPEAEQQYGRAIAVTPFNGKPVVAIAADNEVFMYFRTTLYDETRQ